MFPLGRIGGGMSGTAKQEQSRDLGPSANRQPTVREHLEAQKAYHQEKITAIDKALASLVPDVEKAIDALQAVNF